MHTHRLITWLLAAREAGGTAAALPTHPAVEAVVGCRSGPPSGYQAHGPTGDSLTHSLALR